jgi:sporulation protein YhbH
MTTVIRPYSPSDALRSDRSAGDRLRHRQKVRQAIRENIADIISEESIIGQSRDKIIKVPIRGIREYRFVFGKNNPRVGTGDGDSKSGQVVGKAGEQVQGPGRAGEEAGIDYYETDVALAELIDILFEDLELPDMERKKLNSTLSERLSKRKGYRRVGARVHLDKRRTAISRIRRRVAQGRGLPQTDGERFPFHRDDFKFRRLAPELRPQSNALVLCIMDTSGSMNTLKKYLARSFFFLLYQFVRRRYASVEVVFVAHDTTAREVTEEEFFHKGESGGTFISAGYLKALEIIQARYHPSLWNIYAFHCSDGDNFPHDNLAAINSAKQLCEICNLFGYGEIKPPGSGHGSDSMMKTFEELRASNFHSALIEKKEDIWPGFKGLLAKEEAAA